VLSQTITIGATVMSQSYAYDSLNRLSSASETGGWTQTYDYDRYGNRAVRAGSYIPNASLTPQSAFAGDLSAFNASNNRVVASLYDAAGNQTSDAQNRTFAYDAENRQITFNGTAGQYFYDGDGRRVKKTDASGTTVIVYDVTGRMIAEYHSDPVPPAAGGGGTSYLTSDHLGSTRVVTKADGFVKVRYDYLAFGEELGSGIGSRTVGMGYSAADSTKQKFTQKERDTESGLDFFEARYYSSPQGRFTSVDPIIIAPERVIDPQQLNLFAYARNNPLRFTDPTGEDIVENVADEYKERYKKWKDEYLSTEAGRKQWDKYANDKTFTLTITVSKDKGEGALTDGYKWDANGKLTAATITLGSKLDSGYPSPDHYPVTSSLRQGDPQYNTAVSGEVLAATKIAHEFGHVNRTASVDATLYQLQNKLIPQYNDIFFKSGANDPRLAQLEKQMGGTPVSINKDREHWAEANTIPFLRNRFPGGKGDSMPKRIKKAIESYQKTYPGR
jgi:RHS repeat-associated protein